VEMISQKEFPFASFLLQQTELESGWIPISNRSKGLLGYVWAGFSAVYRLVEEEAEVQWPLWPVLRRDCLKVWFET